MLFAIVLIWKSIYSIGPTQVGLVRKRFGKPLPGDNPIAFQHEAGYQAELLMPGLRFRFLPIDAVTKYPWVQVPAGQIGLVSAQIGQPLPIGAKSAVYTHGFGNFTDLHAFVESVAGPGGQKIKGEKGVQRLVLAHRGNPEPTARSRGILSAALHQRIRAATDHYGAVDLCF